MSNSRNKTLRNEKSPAPTSRLLPQLAVELLIGLGVAVLLVIVAWASSNAIRFVYGGY